LLGFVLVTRYRYTTIPVYCTSNLSCVCNTNKNTLYTTVQYNNWKVLVRRLSPTGLFWIICLNETNDLLFQQSFDSVLIRNKFQSKLHSYISNKKYISCRFWCVSKLVFWFAKQTNLLDDPKFIWNSISLLPDSENQWKLVKM
jgi:hypothetical protein